MDFILETLAECGIALIWIGILLVAIIKNKCTKPKRYGNILKDKL